MRSCSKLLLPLLAVLGLVLSPLAIAATPKVGVVVMHGKGGSPTKFVAELASYLESQGYLVANLDMPWSGKRDYDVTVSTAEAEVETALSALRSKGAQKLFVAGHSQGGVFTLHFAGKHKVDGIICMSPGGSVGNTVFREKLGDAVARAKTLVAVGKGEVKTRLDDYEGRKGVYPVTTTPAIYLTWFDPDGAMNSDRAARVVNPQTPILWIVAKNDYPALRKTNIPAFDVFPKNPHTKLYEPNSDHVGTPSAAREEIVRWITEVIGAGN